MTQKLVLDRFLPYRLSVASNAVSARISSAYRQRFGLKINEWRLIAVLAETPRMTPRMLCDATRIDKIAVSRAASALLARGLVMADANPDDGRSHFLALTTQGRALYAEVAPLALALEEKLFARFSAQERAAMDDILRAIEASAQD